MPNNLKKIRSRTRTPTYASIESIVKTRSGARPKFFVFELDEQSEKYIPHSWGEKERVRRALDDDESTKWEKRKEKTKFYLNLIVDSIKRLLNIPAGSNNENNGH